MLKFLKQWIADTLGFSKAETNGTLILIIIIITLAIIPRMIMHHFYINDYSVTSDSTSLVHWANQMKAGLSPKITDKEDLITKSTVFRFNPNTSTKEELVSLGISEKVANNMIKYRENGGAFEIKNDLKKIYGISQNRIDELWDFIDLPEQKNAVAQTQKTAIATSDQPLEIPSKFDINQATSSDLERIKGIGPAYAKRILKYRDLLGGFVDVSQFTEVYSLPADIIQTLTEKTLVGRATRMINVNTDTIKHLSAHPYIDYNTARAIFNYRNQRGKIDSIDQIKEIKIISDSLYTKISPYLSIRP